MPHPTRRRSSGARKEVQSTISVGAPVTKKGRAPGVLSNYDAYIREKLKQGKKPSIIAEELRSEHGLSTTIASTKAVDNRLRYLKRNSLADFPPTNPENTNIRAAQCTFAV